MRRIIALIMFFSMMLMNISAFSAQSDYLYSASEPEQGYFEQTINQYAADEETFCDPQTITDEEFFGSLLNYEKFPMLRDVKTAAEVQDYAAAKQAIWEYYQEKFASTDLGYTPSTSKNDELIARLYLENVVTTRPIADIIKLTPKLEYFNINVTDNVSNVASVASRRVAFTLVGLKKDGNMGLFYSKESEDAPYMEVTVNGRVRTYRPIADTYIRSGNYSTENYGDEPVLMTEESYSSIGTAQPTRDDSYTKRASLLFDFSGPDGINPGDQVSSATLFIKGMMIKSDCPVQPDETYDFKDIVVMQDTDLRWTDEGYTWKTATTGNIISCNGEYSYAAMPDILELTQRKTAISVYKATKEKAYAYAAVRMITSSIAEQFTSQSGIAGQTTLFLAQGVADFPHMAAELSRIPYMTAEKYTLILKYIYATSQQAIIHWTPNEENTNYGVANAAGVMISALAYPEFCAADEPLGEPANPARPGGRTGGWHAVGTFRVDYCAKKYMFDDGSCTEVPFSYVRYVLNLFNRIFTISGAMGIEEREVMSAEVLSELEKYFVYLMDMSNPQAGGGSFQQGDDASTYLPVAINGGHARMLRAIGNPYLDWLFSNKTKGDAPPYLSIAYDSGQKAVLRSDWSTMAMAAQINADGSQTTHGHTDDLGLNLYAYERMLLVDPIQPDYDTDRPVTAWLYSNRAHNTVEINNTSQNGKGADTVLNYVTPEGKEEIIYPGTGAAGTMGSLHPENREFNPMYNFLRAETENYKNHPTLEDDFTVLRDILFIEPEYFIVTDYLEPQNNKTAVNHYAQHWHMLPDANISLDGNNIKTNFISGANIIIAQVNGEIPVTGSIESGWYENDNTHARYARYVKDAAGTVTFNTVLYPQKEGENSTVTIRSITLDIPEADASAFSMTITDNIANREKQAHFYSLHNETLKEQREFGGYATDGILAFVQQMAGNYDKAIIRNGTNITDTTTGKAIVSSRLPISDLGITWSGNELTLHTSKEDIVFDQLAIYAPATQKLVINDVEYSFTREGDNIVPYKPAATGETPPSSPALPPVTPDIPPSVENTRPSHATNTGGGGSGASAPSFPSIPIGDVAVGSTEQIKPLPFSNELDGHWGEEQIQAMIGKGFITGDDMGRLNLANPVTRAEFVTLLVRAMGITQSSYNGEFPDVNGNDWYATYIAAAKSAGILEGSNGYALPNDIITREQMAKILVNAYNFLNPNASKVDIPSLSEVHTDADFISEWATGYVLEAVARGLLVGFEDGRFMPQESVLREQAFVAVYRLIQ